VVSWGKGETGWVYTVRGSETGGRHHGGIYRQTMMGKEGRSERNHPEGTGKRAVLWSEWLWTHFHLWEKESSTFERNLKRGARDRRELGGTKFHEKFHFEGEFTNSCSFKKEGFGLYSKGCSSLCLGGGGKF